MNNESRKEDKWKVKIVTIVMEAWGGKGKYAGQHSKISDSVLKRADERKCRDQRRTVIKFREEGVFVIEVTWQNVSSA